MYLCVMYRNVFRTLCNEPMNCNVCIKVFTFLQNGDKEKIYSFMKNKAKSNNSILRGVMNSDTPRSPFYRHWRKYFMFMHCIL